VKKSLFAFLLFLFCAGKAYGTSLEQISIQLPDTIHDTLQQEKKEIIHGKSPVKKENKKLVAAILAFPVPFGFLGLHRIYLGTEPWVPVVYLVTFGGGMILPLIDFIAIICADKEELKKYEKNARLFMWVK
jgi:TM2 domain-containing membrane protein YozV